MTDSGNHRRKPSEIKAKAEASHFWRIPEWFPEINEANLAKLKIYQDDLILFNARMSLISPRTEQVSDFVHIADGILGSHLVASNFKSKEIYDFGSGNGVPGVIFALLYPAHTVRLVEADGRKIEYLKHCVAKMGLKNCIAVHARIEDLGEGVVSGIVTRGLASISKSLLLARRCSAMGCQFFHFKGQAWSKEIAEIPSQILSSWDLKHVGDYRLPDHGPLMSIILTTRK